MNKRDPFIQEVIKDASLPNDSKFMGYVVRRPIDDEFLHTVKYDGEMEARTWSHAPEMAKIYKTKKKANKEVTRYGKDAMLGYLFDAGNFYFVASEES